MYAYIMRQQRKTDRLRWPSSGARIRMQTRSRDRGRAVVTSQLLDVRYVLTTFMRRRAASTFSSCAASLHRRANSSGELEIVRGAAAAATFIFIKESQLLVFRVLVGCTHPVFTRCQNIALLRCKPPATRIDNNLGSKTLTEPLNSYELKKVHLFV